ncbi:MAG: acyl carrier protein [Myxococcota bacterium]
MNNEAITDALREIFERECGAPLPEKLDVDIQRELGLDSLQQQTVVIEIESHFDIDFDPLAEVITTVEDVVAVVTRCIEEREL